MQLISNRTLIQKQKPLGLRKIDLENMTLRTLKLICGIVYSRIKRVKFSKSSSKHHEMYNLKLICISIIRSMCLIGNPNNLLLLFKKYYWIKE